MKFSRLLFVAITIVLIVFVCILAYQLNERSVREIETLSESGKASLEDFESLGRHHQVVIAQASEPGESLTLCLTFVRKSDQEPFANEQIHLYHANVDGEYEPEVADDETTARLRGDGITDEKGRLLVKTILPGDYGSSADNRHIHTTVPNAKPAGYDIHFKQYSSLMLRRFVASSDQHFLADLKRNHEGNLVGFVTIECKFSSGSSD